MSSFSSRFLLGGLIVLVGVILLLDQFGIGSGLSNLWPLTIVVVGLYMILRNTRNLLPGFFVLLVGIFLQLDSLKVLSFSVWNLWPLFIIFIGVSTLLGRRGYSSSKTVTDQDFVRADATFWAEERVVKGVFKGAIINAVFGGVKLDLRDAKIEENVTIDINLVFGGVELLVPDNVHILNRGVGIFGGVSNKTRSFSNENYKTIEITGNAIFGGVDIK